MCPLQVPAHDWSHEWLKSGLPESVADLHAIVTSSLSGALPRTSSFCLAGETDDRAVCRVKLVDGCLTPLSPVPRARLDAKMRDLGLGKAGRPCRVIFRASCDPSEAASLSDTLGAPADWTEMALLRLEHDGEWLGAAGIAHVEGQGRFTDATLLHVEQRRRFSSWLAFVQKNSLQFLRSAEVMCCLGRQGTSFYVVDCDLESVVWCQHDVPSDQVRPRVDEQELVRIARYALDVQRSNEQAPSQILPCGTVVKVAELLDTSAFGGNRCAAMAVRPHLVDYDGAMQSLSNRERQIANLLIEGYTSLNAAAIIGVSENTIRTYVRRMYRKIGVSNRAELMRRVGARW